MVAFSDPPKTTHDDRNTLFLNNLPYSVTEEKIIEGLVGFVFIFCIF